MCVTASTAIPLLFFYRGLCSDSLRFLLCHFINLDLLGWLPILAWGLSSTPTNHGSTAFVFIRGAANADISTNPSIIYTRFMSKTEVVHWRFELSSPLLIVWSMGTWTWCLWKILIYLWTVKGSKKRRNRIERGKMVKVKDTLFFLFFQLFTLILYHLFRFFAIFRHSNF